MKAGARYSHLNGEEYLLVHKPELWREVNEVISEVDAASCKVKKSKERTMPGRMLYSPPAMNSAFKAGLKECPVECPTTSEICRTCSGMGGAFPPCRWC